MLPELYAKLTDEYEMDADEARRLVLEKLGDQLVPTPTEPTLHYWEEPVDLSQIATIHGYMNAIATDPNMDEFFESIGIETGRADHLLKIYLKDLKIENLEGLNRGEARDLINILDKYPADLWAYNLRWQYRETGGFSWPTAMIIIATSVGGIGVAYATLNRYLGKTATQAAAKVAAKHAPTLVHATSEYVKQPGFFSRLLGRVARIGRGGVSPAFAPIAIPFETEPGPGPFGLQAVITPEMLQPLPEEEREALRLARESALRLARARERGERIVFRRPTPSPRRLLRF